MTLHFGSFLAGGLVTFLFFVFAAYLAKLMKDSEK